MGALAVTSTQTSTQPVVQLGAEPARRFVARTSALAIVGSGACAVCAVTSSLPGLQAQASSYLPAWIGLTLVSAVGAVSPLGRHAQLAWLWLVGLLGGLGLVAGAVSSGALEGFGLALGTSLWLGDVVAAVWLLLGRTRALGLSLGVAALVTMVLACFGERGPVPVSSLGVAMGGACALVLLAHARFVDGSVAWMHPAKALGPAALSRTVWWPRRVVSLWVGAEESL
jgi:hypothetical protein